MSGLRLPFGEDGLKSEVVRLNELDVFAFLVKHEVKEDIPWKKYIDNCYKNAVECVFILTTIAKIREHRKNEKERGVKRISSTKLMAQIQQKIDEGEGKIVSYFPLQIEWLDKMMQQGPSVFIDNIEEEKNIKIGIDCALALQGAFLAMSNNLTTYPPLNRVALVLTTLLFQMMHSASELFKKVGAEERLGDQNSYNASTWTPAKIEEYKKHEKYPRLEYLIKSCKNTPKEIRTINGLLKKILGTENRATIKRYRYLLTKEIGNE